MLPLSTGEFYGWCTLFGYTWPRSKGTALLLQTLWCPSTYIHHCPKIALLKPSTSERRQTTRYYTTKALPTEWNHANGEWLMIALHLKSPLITTWPTLFLTSAQEKCWNIVNSWIISNTKKIVICGDLHKELATGFNVWTWFISSTSSTIRQIQRFDFHSFCL